MSLPALDNLVRIGQLKAEPRNEAEVGRMLTMARIRLADAQLPNLSPGGRPDHRCGQTGMTTKICIAGHRGMVGSIKKG